MLKLCKIRNDIINNLNIPLVIIGCIQMYVTAEIFSVIGFVYFAYLFIKKRFTINKGYSNGIKILLIVFIYGLLIGVSNIGNRAYIRDIYYYLNPILFILIGLYLSNSTAGFEKVLNSVVAVSVIISLICFVNMVWEIAHGVSLLSTRNYFDCAIWGDIFSIGVLMQKFKKSHVNYKLIGIILLFLSIVCFMGLSRTVLIQLILLLLVILFYGRNKIKALIKLIGISVMMMIVISLLIQFAPDSMLSNFFTKILNSFTEINTNNIWTPSEIQDNWRGYEMYCVQEQFESQGLIGRIFGHGFGTGIYVGKYASLVHQTGNYIYVIHNGFYCMLIKEGIIGVLLYVLFYIDIFWNAMNNFRKHRKQYDILIMAIIVCLIVYSYFVKGIFSDFVQYNALLIIGGWMGLRNSPDDLKSNYRLGGQNV